MASERIRFSFINIQKQSTGKLPISLSALKIHLKCFLPSRRAFPSRYLYRRASRWFVSCTVRSLWPCRSRNWASGNWRLKTIGIKRWVKKCSHLYSWHHFKRVHENVLVHASSGNRCGAFSNDNNKEQRSHFETSQFNLDEFSLSYSLGLMVL